VQKTWVSYAIVSLIPPYLCAENISQLPQLTVLLDAGAAVNASNAKKRTPLHYAVNANGGGADATAELPEFLISRGADVFALDCRGRLPLHYVFVKIGK
jgi:ankyrin repeat protein